jgi:hypothetical protein
MERNCIDCKKCCRRCSVPEKVLLKNAASFLEVKKKKVHYGLLRDGNTWTIQANANRHHYQGSFREGIISDEGGT